MTVYRQSDERAVCLHRTEGSTFWPTHEELRVAARTLMGALEIDLAPFRVVLIKPNLCINRLTPDCGINTHVAFVHGLVEHFQRRGHRVLVAEGGSSYDPVPGEPIGSMSQTWERSGYRAMAQATGCELVNLNAGPYHDWPCPGGVRVSRFRVSEPMLVGRPFVINVATLKTHGLARMTLCIKNFQGILEPSWSRPAEEGDRHFCRIPGPGPCPDGVPIQQHRAQWTADRRHVLAERLTDLLSAYRADLSLVEGMIAREGSGFTTGWNVPTRVVIAGRNPASVDAVGAWVAGHVPEQTEYLCMAHDRGLGETRLDRVHLLETHQGEIRGCQDPHAYVSPWPLRVFPAGSTVAPYPDVPQPESQVAPKRPAA